jgi:capsular exopolysaccharide synthesis family protein
MIKISEELASVDQQINGETQRILSSLQSDVAVARSQVGVVERSLRDAQGLNATASQAGVQLRELQRNAESAKSLYEAFLKRFNELGEQGTLQTTDARVISRATVPSSPSYPKTSLYLAGSLAAALFAAAVVAFSLEQFDRGLRTRQQVEAELGLPMLASLPLEEPSALDWDGGTHNASEVVVRKPLSGYNEAFRLLRAGIQLSNVDAPPVLVLITSALPSEGKSTGALSLARSAALAGDRVLLIDGDIRRPGISKILGLDTKESIGLVQCITGEVQIDQAIIPDGITPLHILLAGTSVRNPPDLLSSVAMRNLLAAVKKDYDLVIIDSSPVLPAIDSRLFGRLVDTTVFFVRWEDTPKDAANEALRLLQDFNAPVAGVALTMTDRRRQSRYGYYGDSYSYYGHYKNYYTS